MKHTSEPWHIVEHNWEETGIYPEIGSRLAVCEIDGAVTEDTQEHYEAIHVANAQRIVACVNACAGMTNEELDDFSDGSLKFWIDDSDDIMKSVCVALLDVDYLGRCEHGIYALKKDRDSLAAQNAELIETMKWIHNHGGLGYSIHGALEKAIAKAGAV